MSQLPSLLNPSSCKPLTVLGRLFPRVVCSLPTPGHFCCVYFKRVQQSKYLPLSGQLCERFHLFLEILLKTISMNNSFNENCLHYIMYPWSRSRTSAFFRYAVFLQKLQFYLLRRCFHLTKSKFSLCWKCACFCFLFFVLMLLFLELHVVATSF